MSPLRSIPRGYAPSSTASRRWPSTTARNTRKALRPLDIPACALIRYYRDADYHTTGVNVKVAGAANVGYIMGTGDDVPRSLEDLGVHVKFLSPQDIPTGNLSAYDAIIVGIRAYAAAPKSKPRTAGFSITSKGGGVVLVQYQSPEYDHNYGPYPFSFGPNPEKVVEEDDKVTLAPERPRVELAQQNHRDGLLRTGSRSAVTILSLNGIQSTLRRRRCTIGAGTAKGRSDLCPLWQGVYVYMAFAFFRQMPDGVPGSFRIMANLISMGKNPDLAKNVGN